MTHLTISTTATPLILANRSKISSKQLTSPSIPINAFPPGKQPIFLFTYFFPWVNWWSFNSSFQVFRTFQEYPNCVPFFTQQPMPTMRISTNSIPRRCPHYPQPKDLDSVDFDSCRGRNHQGDHPGWNPPEKKTRSTPQVHSQLHEGLGGWGIPSLKMWNILLASWVRG